MALIEVKNVTHYYGETLAVRNVSFSVEQGEFVALIGRNGSGKSTIAKLLNGLLTPFSGSVVVDGMDTSTPEHAFNIRSNVGVVFQNPDNQMVATIIEDDIAFGPENLGIPPAEINERIDYALSCVDMLDHRKGTATRLSGGQKQRIAIAGILAMRPKILVLDESTSMLDPQGRRKIMQTARQLNEQGITVIIITHFMDEAALADRIIVMNKGELRYNGGKDLFQNTELVEECGLELPIAAQLATSIRKYIPLKKHTITPDLLINELKAHGLAAPLSQPTEESTKPFSEGSLLSSPPNKESETAQQAQRSGKKAVEVKNLSYIYNPKSPFKVAAIKDVTLDVFEGEFFGIIGHTGCGKSTLVRHLNGLIKLKGNGKIVSAGIDLSQKFNYKELRSSVGMVFQYPEYQLFETTVALDIAFGMKNVGVPEAELESRIRESMEAVGLEPSLAERSPFELSGGQKRRAAIAGVIAMRPKILILDEPTAGLDPRGRKEILSTIHRIKEQFCPTVIMISHNMDEIAEHCTRIAVMNDGKLLMESVPSQLFSRSKEIIDIGLDVPTPTRIALGLGYHNVCTSQQLIELCQNKGFSNNNSSPPSLHSSPSGLPTSPSSQDTELQEEEV